MMELQMVQICTDCGEEGEGAEEQRNERAMEHRG